MFPRDASPERQLRTPWAGLLGAGWIAIGLALVAVAASSRRVGKPVWWLGDGTPVSFSVLWVVPLIVPFLAVMTAHTAARLALAMSAVAAASVAAVAAGDLNGSPASSLVQFVLAGAGAVLTLAATAGLPTRRPKSSPR